MVNNSVRDKRCYQELRTLKRSVKWYPLVFMETQDLRNKSYYKGYDEIRLQFKYGIKNF